MEAWLERNQYMERPMVLGFDLVLEYLGLLRSGMGENSWFGGFSVSAR